MFSIVVTAVRKMCLTFSYSLLSSQKMSNKTIDSRQEESNELETDEMDLKAKR